MKARRPLLIALVPAFAAIAAACSGGSGALSHVTEPIGTSDGTLGAWRALHAMPEPRANHCAVAVNGWLLVIGGNYLPAGQSSFVSSDEVLGAPLENGGALGHWRVLGHLPSAVVQCTAAVDGDAVVILDGLWDDATDERKLWRATVGADGTIGTWIAGPSLPAGRRLISSLAWASGGSLFAIEDDLDANLLRVMRLDGGTTWTDFDWHPGWIGRPELAVADAGVFALGGYLGDENNTVVASSMGVTFSGGAVVGSALATSALPEPIAFGDAAVADGWVFVVGGRGTVFGASASTHVWAAQASGATLGAWSAVSSLPEGRSNHVSVLAGNWLYVTGGGNGGPGLDTVFVAQARQF